MSFSPRLFNRDRRMLQRLSRRDYYAWLRDPVSVAAIVAVTARNALLAAHGAMP